ncbi:MAG: phosphoribosylamine--glycine ligase, partial [Anaerolineae bacterium]|nr:phosphoribosylamine--glycine ligase [Anaerolineae bacterium]
MNILVVGSGGREHALSWKLARSRQVDHVYVAPGNGGTATAEHISNISIDIEDSSALVAFAQQNNVGLTVIGPEIPLANGLVDLFNQEKLPVFGPTAGVARLESSKAFAKTFMVEEGIPTAPAVIFSDYNAACAYINQLTIGPVVVKADGLAAGKGVLVCDTPQQALDALQLIMVDRAFGSAGDRVLIEDRLFGEETSLLAFTDGRTVVPMIPARDYKRALNGDQGLNTGGMGGYAPSPYLSPDMVSEIMHRVLRPAVDGMAWRGTPYVGVLYAGLMLTETGPRVLEFNCRFGDPETQLLMPLLETDLTEVMLACIEGRLDSMHIRWQPGYSVGVVLASGGYPGTYAKDKVITGIPHSEDNGIMVFHAGTRWNNGTHTTSGGRVLAVIAQDASLEVARQRAYQSAKTIVFDNCHYRTDIASNISTHLPDHERASQSAYAAAGVDIDAGE